jgi:hypothetical protein
MAGGKQQPETTPVPTEVHAFDWEATDAGAVDNDGDFGEL